MLIILQMHLHGNNLENIYKVIQKSTLPEDYLPDDYEGPTAGPIQSLIGRYARQTEI